MADITPANRRGRACASGFGMVYSPKSRALERLREEILILAEDLPELVPLHG
jgi:hypothetical protein